MPNGIMSQSFQRGPIEGIMKKAATAMTIEIHKPEREALIRQQMESGAYQNFEDMLIDALKSSATRRFRPVPVFGEPISQTILRDRGQR